MTVGDSTVTALLAYFHSVSLKPYRPLDQLAIMSSFLFIYAIAAFLSSSCPSAHFAVDRYACNDYLNNLTDINTTLT